MALLLEAAGKIYRKYISRTSGDVCHLACHRVPSSEAEHLSPEFPFCCIFLTVEGSFCNVTGVLSGILPSLGVYLQKNMREYVGLGRRRTLWIKARLNGSTRRRGSVL
jgi:hypothetical protein